MRSFLLFIKFVNQVSFHKTIYNLDHFFGDSDKAFLLTWEIERSTTPHFIHINGHITECQQDKCKPCHT